MELKNFFAQDDQGNVLANALCFLYTRGTETLATGLQDATGQMLANPFSADGVGLIQFAAPNGHYDLRVVKDNRDYRIRIKLADVTNPPTPLGARVEDYSATAALRYDIQEINGSSTSRGAQAFAFDERNRHMYLSEGGQLTRYPMDGDAQVSPIDSTGAGSTAVGHQGLAVEYIDESIRLWTTASVGGRYAARMQYTPNKPITTAEIYELFTAGMFENNTSCTPAISTCKQYLIAHGMPRGKVSHTKVRVFEISTLLAHGPGDCTGLYLHEWNVTGLADSGNPLQGLACDGNNVFLIAGGTGFTATVNKRLFVYSLDGTPISRDTDITIGQAVAAGDASGTRYEPEGLSIISAASGGQVLMVGILSGDSGSRRFRIYGCGLAKPLVARSFDIIGNHKGRLIGSVATDRDFVAVRSRTDLSLGSGTNWYGNFDLGRPGGLADFTNGRVRRETLLNGETTLSGDAGVAPLNLNRPDSGAVLSFTRGTKRFGYVNMSTADVGLFSVNGAAVRFATAPLDSETPTVRWQVENGGALAPYADGVYNVGSANRRVGTYFGSTDAISTSDETMKAYIQSIPDEVMDALEGMEFSMYQFIESVDQKGDGARWHFGVIAQRVKQAFEAQRLDPFAYGLLCYDAWEDTYHEWPDEYEVIEATYSEVLVGEDGQPIILTPETKVLIRKAGRELVLKGGYRYGIRYNEMLCLKAALISRTIKRQTESYEARFAEIERSLFKNVS